MPGQYSHLKSQLEGASEEPERQQELDKVKQELLNLSMGELGDRYRELYDLKEKLKGQLADVQLKLDAHNQLLVSQLEAQGLGKMSTTDGSTTLWIKDSVYTTTQNRHEYLTWIRENGLEDLLSVHYSTMNAQVTDRLQKGQQIPPGLKAFFKQTISIRRNSK